MKKESDPSASIVAPSNQGAVSESHAIAGAKAASAKSVSAKASKSESLGPLALGRAMRPEKERLSGGGLAIKATIRLSVMSIFCQDEDGQFKRCLMHGGKFVRASREKRENESQDWLFWAPQGLSLSRLKRRLAAALPGWSITETTASHSDEKTAALVKEGWASEAAELQCSFQAKDALNLPWDEGVERAQKTFERELSMMCELPPLSRPIDPWGDVLACLMPSGDNLNSMERACREMIIEDEKRGLEAATPERPSKARPRL